jgi:A/G-specific adenine glycosylase
MKQQLSKPPQPRPANRSAGMRTSAKDAKRREKQSPATGSNLSRHFASLADKPQLFRSRLVSWFEKNGRDLPWRRTRDPYAILVSEIMLQQTQVNTVIDFYGRWLKRFPDFAALANASEADVLRAWQGLGYYSRARNLHRAAKTVVEKHAGQMPRELDAIRALPGVGRYTAGAVAAFAFDRPAAIVDANIARVLARLFDLREPIDSAAGRKFLWERATDLQPPENGRAYNSALMELGALVCLPKRPKCSACPVQRFCSTENPELLPVKKPRRRTVFRAEHCAFVTCDGKLLLQLRDETNHWRGLWTLPRLHQARNGNGPWFQTEYPFTHHRVTLSVFKCSAPKTIESNHQWVEIARLDEFPMPSPHRRAVHKALELDEASRVATYTK